MPMRRIVTRVTDLPNLAHEDTLVIDNETTSFDDQVKALHPFNGHRVCGYGIGTTSGDVWYLPVRHRPFNEGINIAFEPAVAWLRELGRQPRTWVGHNPKFDCRFAHQDGIEFKGTLQDTVVLARLVNAMRFSAELDVLAKEYLPDDFRKVKTPVNDYLRAARSKDFGTVPPDIMGARCMQDIVTTSALRDELLLQLSPESANLWKIEQRLTSVLLASEIRGIYVPRIPLKKHVLSLLHRISDASAKLEGIAGVEVDVLSNVQLTKMLRDKLCIQPTSWTPNGVPSWSAEDLRGYGLPVTDLVADLKELYAQVSTCGEGWLKRLDDDDTLHPNFKQFGTKTGRLSCEDPNFQNVDEVGKMQVEPRKGHGFLSIDFSQIEYRLFAHYTNSPRLITKYNEDPRTDYHQEMADTLGIPRKPTKNLNFGFLYGMGREKLETSLTVFIKEALRSSKPEDRQVLEKLTAFNFGEPVDDRNAHRIAAAVYSTVHRKVPEIRQFASRVKLVLGQRGFIKDIYGRIFRPPPGMVAVDFAHKFRNAVIQGAAADLLKDRIVELPAVMLAFDAHLLTNVHDEVLLEVPIDALVECAETVIPVLEAPSVPIRVPVRVDCAVCTERWGKKVPLATYKEATRGTGKVA